MLFETPRCVCVCATLISSPPCRALFTVLCSALQSERKSQWRGFQNSVQLLRKPWEVFSPSSCSLTSFLFPSYCSYFFIPLHSHPHSPPPNTHFFFSFLSLQLQSSAAAQSYTVCCTCAYRHSYRCVCNWTQKQSDNSVVWRFQMQ